MSRPRNTTSCDECRRRKLRCDAQQPRCGFCLRSNLACEASSRGKRGPKRGHLNALRSRLCQLEEMLQGRVQSPVVIGNAQPISAIGTQEATFGNLNESPEVSQFEAGLLIDLTVHVELYQMSLYQGTRKELTYPGTNCTSTASTLHCQSSINALIWHGQDQLPNHPLSYAYSVSCGSSQSSSLPNSVT
jgi:hypothetical protein